MLHYDQSLPLFDVRHNIVAMVVRCRYLGCLEWLSVVAHEKVSVLVRLGLLNKDVWPEKKEPFVPAEVGVELLLRGLAERVALSVERDGVVPSVGVVRVKLVEVDH